MSNEAAAPIEAVNATSSTTTTPATPEQTTKKSPAKAKAQQQAPSYQSNFEKVVSDLGKKYGLDDGQDTTPTLSEVVDKVQAEAKAAPVEKKQQEPPKPAPTKKKLKVAEKEYELDEEQVDRFAQKGIYYEKKGVELAKLQKATEERVNAITQKEEFLNNVFESLKSNPMGVLSQLLGEQEARKAIEPWLGDKILREIEYEKNPQQKAIDEANAKALQYQQELEKYRQQQYQQELESKTEQYRSEYEKLIIDALNQEGVPKTDFTAAEMAHYIRGAVKRGVQYTPQELAQQVKEDNNIRIRAMLGSLVDGVNGARKSNDSGTLVKLGGQIAELLGDDVVYALAKYHLARMQQTQPQQPKQVLDTVKTQVEERKGWGRNGRQYMSEDEYADMRRKIAAGLMEPPAGW